MPDRYAIDVPNTYSDAMFRYIEPKMQPVNKDDPNSPQEQAKNKEGVLQWLVTLSFSVKPTNGGKTKLEDVTATVNSPVRPFEKIPLGSLVAVEGLKMGIMKQDKGGFSLFYSLDNIRPATPVRTAAAG